MLFEVQTGNTGMDGERSEIMKYTVFIGIGMVGMSLVFPSYLEAFKRRIAKKTQQIKSEFELTSQAFANNGPIPVMFTCDGQEISPPLRWEHVPQGTQSFAVMIDDLDARGGHWTHWLVFDLPKDLQYLPVNANIAYYKGIEGTNDWGTKDYGGPCPPLKKHRYLITVYALKVPTLKLTSNATRAEFLRTIRPVVIGQAKLIGTYQRPSKR